MASKNYTVEQVNNLFAEVVVETFAATPKGQAHLNRIAKAITNESIESRKQNSYVTYAQRAFDQKVSEYVASKSPKLEAFVAGKEEWVKAYIAKHYETEEE